MPKKNYKIITLFFLIIILAFTNNTIHAKETKNMNIAIGKGLNIVNNFDYYEIKTPEEYHEIGKEFSMISEKYLKDIEKDKTYGLEKILNACYSGLNCKDINMLEVHESFEKLKEFSEKFSKKTANVKRSEVILKIQNYLGSTEGIILGYENSLIKEDQYITKAELGTIIFRIINKYNLNSNINKIVEIKGSENHWSKDFISNEFVASILDFKTNS